MKNYSYFFATLLTPPAFILNIADIIKGNVNFILVSIISLLTIVFWIVSIRNKNKERIKTEKEIELLDQQIKKEKEKV